MKFQPLKLSVAIAMALMAGGAAAAGSNSVNVHGTGLTAENTNNVDSSGASGAVIKIEQVSDGIAGTTGINQIGTSSQNFVVTGSGAKVSIGQGAYYNGTTFAANTYPLEGSDNNKVSGSVNGSEVEISQLSDKNTVNITTASGSGKVTVIQGNASASKTPLVGFGGRGYTATIDQKAGTGTVNIEQGNIAQTQNTSGTVDVVHEGSHNVSIYQNRTTDGANGTVATNTKGGAGGANNVLNIENTNSGNVYVNSAGDSTNAGAIDLAGKVMLVNAGTGDISIKQLGSAGETNVYANIEGTANLNINQTTASGAANNIYINNARGSNNSGAGMSGGTVNITGGGTSGTIEIHGMNNGTLNIDTGGASNKVTVDAFTGAGLVAVSQGALSSGSNLLIKSMTSAGNFTINQNGSGAITLDITGASGTTATYSGTQTYTGSM